MPKSKRSGTTYRRYRPYVSMAYRGIKNALRMYGKYRVGSGRSRRGITDAGGITTQHDSKRQYLRKSAPRRVRRRARKRYQRFVANSMKLVGTRQYLKNTAGSIDNNTVGQQTWDSIVLYGYGPNVGVSGTARGYNDINDIVANDTLLNNTINDPSFRLSGGSSRMYFDTGILDVTFQNNSSATIGGTNVTVGIELDVYEFTASRKVERADAFDGVNNYTWHQFITNMAAADNTTQGGGLTQISPYDRGATPFEFGVQLYQAGIKIGKKTKYFLPYGNTCTVQLRDSKNHELRIRDYINNPQPTTTFGKGLFVIAKILPTEAGSLSAQFLSVKFGCTRKYKYKVFSSSQDRSGKS